MLLTFARWMWVATTEMNNLKLYFQRVYIFSLKICKISDNTIIKDRFIELYTSSIDIDHLPHSFYQKYSIDLLDWFNKLSLHYIVFTIFYYK